MRVGADVQAQGREERRIQAGAGCRSERLRCHSLIEAIFHTITCSRQHEAAGGNMSTDAHWC